MTNATDNFDGTIGYVTPAGVSVQWDGSNDWAWFWYPNADDRFREGERVKRPKKS